MYRIFFMEKTLDLPERVKQKSFEVQLQLLHGQQQSLDFLRLTPL